MAVPNRPAKVVGHQDAGDDRDGRQGGCFQRNREPLNDVGTVTRHGCLADRAYRAETDAGVVLRDPDNRTRQRQADDAAPQEIESGDFLAGRCSDNAVAAKDIIRRDPKPADGKDAGSNNAAIERPHDRVVGAKLDEQRTNDRRDDAGCTNGKRINHHGIEIVAAGKEDSGENHGGDNGDGIGLEQVGGHTSAVTDVIADVVGNCGRVARVVFGNASFDFADEITADVRALGEDSATETCEYRDERGAEAKCH